MSDTAKTTRMKPTSTLTRVFGKSTDAVFGINTDGRILFCNHSFRRLLGYRGDQLQGSRCARVLCGTDLHGRAFCGENCPIPKTVREQPAISDFDLVVRRADGDSLLVNIGASYLSSDLQDSGGVNVLFSMRRVNPRRMLNRIAMSPPDENGVGHSANPADRVRLTSREKEILTLAARGLKTGEIAAQLFVSTQTVRSHFKNIYPKLGVSSRVEAVLYAIRHLGCGGSAVKS